MRLDGVTLNGIPRAGSAEVSEEKPVLGTGMAPPSASRPDERQVKALQAQNAEKLKTTLEPLVRQLLADGVHPSRLAVEVGRRLPDLLASGALLDTSAYRPGKGYGKFELYNYTHAAYPFSIWGFAFGPGQKTPVHDHRCECVSMLVEGTLREQRYDQVGEEGRIKYARLTSDRTRLRLDAKVLEPDQPNIHSLANVSDEVAVTVHLYALDADGPNTSSIREVYKLVDGDVSDQLRTVE